MNANVWKLLRLTCLLGLTGAAIFVAEWNTSARAKSPAAWDNDRFNGKTVEGTWSVKVTQIDCNTKAPKGPAFPSLLAFAGDGTMVEDTNNPGFAIGQRGPGVGIWSHDGHHTYLARSIAFIHFGTPGNPPMVPPFKTGKQTISQTITFENDPDEFTSEAAIEFADNATPTPNAYLNGCATATGTRFK
jgi:hypothetical protein